MGELLIGSIVLIIKVLSLRVLKFSFSNNTAGNLFVAFVGVGFIVLIRSSCWLVFVLINMSSVQCRVYFVIQNWNFCLYFSISPVKVLLFLSLYNSSVVFLFLELHAVHSPLHLWPADLDGQPFHFRLWLLQRWPYCQVIQAICTTEGAGAGGEITASCKGFTPVRAAGLSFSLLCHVQLKNVFKTVVESKLICK